MLRESRKRQVAWDLAHLLSGQPYSWNYTGPNPAGVECVNVPNAFRRVLGLPQIHGNASAWWEHQDGETINFPGYEAARLLAGDIVVYPVSADRPDGHVQLVLDGHSPRNLTVLEENSPEGAPVRVSTYPLIELVRILRS